jgi:hypothetical protein
VVFSWRTPPASDLQERFIAYAVEIIMLSEQLPETKAGRHKKFTHLK